MALNASLDALPNELLYEILRYLTRENDGAIPRRYRMTTTFASINRRLRQFALPHIFTEIRVPNYDRFRAMFVVFRPHLSRISSVRVGHPPLRRLSLLDALELYCDRLLPAVFDFVRLQNLVNFDCLGFCFEPKELAEVFGVSNPTLQSLRLSWDGCRVFPFHTFPSLENLFIQVIPRELPIHEDCLHRSTSPSLVTLSIIDTLLWFDTKICGRMTFPNLRAFHMLPSSLDCCSRILGFISDHPTLLEVNIPRMYINFPDFIKLAKGERNISWHTRLHLMEDDPSRFEISSLPPTYDPDFAKWSDSELGSFSFVRATRTHPEDAVDPLPAHTLTELSMTTSPAEESFLLTDLGELGKLPLFADCTRLSLVLADNGGINPELDTVESIVDVLQESLPKWNHLRYFYLGCTFPSLWGDIFPYATPLPMRGDEPLNLKTYCEQFGDPFSNEEIWECVTDAGLECNDDTCMMQMWKEMHEEEMAAWVRSLAWACMSLEVFEWSMRDFDFYAGDLIMGRCAHPPLWRWDIHRKNGGVRLVSGHLTWNGHPNHPPSPSLGEGFRKYKD